MSSTLVDSKDNGKQQILERIRNALPGVPSDPAISYAAIERLYQRHGQQTPAACIAHLIDRLVDYDTEVYEVQEEAHIVGAIAQALQRAKAADVLAAADFPAAWLPCDAIVHLDHNLSTEQIEAVAAVVTTCEVAVASTGTLFLVHGGSQGRRVLTLLPDLHICVIRRDQVVETIPEALVRLGPVSTRPITTISGPSATSDIEMTRIRGVHGPRRLAAILYGPLREVAAADIPASPS